jgi:hypothetical protein
MIVSLAKPVQQRGRVPFALAMLFAALVCPFGWASVARAISVPAEPIWGHLTIDGPAIVRDATIDIDCNGYEAFSCDVHLRFELVAGASGARIERPRTWVIRPPRLRVNGREVGAEVVLAPNDRVTFEMAYSTYPMDLRPRKPVSPWGAPWILPVDARHFLLGESWRFVSYPRVEDLVIIRARSVEVAGSVRVNASPAPHTHIRVDSARVPEWPHLAARLPVISIEVDRVSEPVVHGGPVVTLGGLIRTDGTPTRFILGLGYELGFADYFLVSAWIETDFESIQEAVLLEVASPALYFVPSVAAGIGVVSTQLGNRDVDFGLRLRASFNIWVLGFVADFDYFFESDGWSIALAARLSI